MIHYTQGNLLDTQCDALVNAVNTVGVMGKGIALQFKQHWKNLSRLEWIRDGLQDLRRVIVAHEISSVAVPALGAGLGGLSWPSVRQFIEQILGEVAAEIYVFVPLAPDRNGVVV